MARLTPQKQKFLDAWWKHQDVTKACKTAKYSQPANGYKILRQDANGVYVDDAVRQYLAHLSGFASTPTKITPISPISVKGLAATIVQFPTSKTEDGDAFLPSVSAVHRLLWEMAQDPNMSGGPRVAAATALLKDLRGEPVEVDVAPEDVVADLKSALGV
jgi:hypothetical protein